MKAIPTAALRRASRQVLVVAGGLMLALGALVGLSSVAGATGTVLYAASVGLGGANCVDPADACTLPDALSSATAGDTIDLETSGSTSHYVGQFTLVGGTIGSPITIQPGPGVSDPTLDGDGSGSVLTIASGYADVNGITVTNGSAADGGGIKNLGTASLTNDTITANTASGGGGGGILNWFGATITLADDTISGNTAATSTVGGGLFNAGGTATLTNDTISGNSSGDDGGGGGIANYYGGTVTLLNDTLSGNTVGAFSGGGGAIYNDSGSTVNTEGTILSGLSDGSQANTTDFEHIVTFTDNCAGGGTYTDNGSNLEDDTTCFSNPDENVTDAEIALSALADNGGPTMTEAISSASVARAIVPAADCPETDQRGVARPLTGYCDAGAYQFVVPSPIVIITTLGTYGTPLQLETYGVTGGLPIYFVTPGSAGCSLSDLTELVASSPGTCVVTAAFNGMESAPTLITFQPAAQAPLTITSTSGTYGTPLALTASGGSDGGAITYGVTSPGTAGCSVSGSSLSATSAGTCTVTATMAGNVDYQPVSSAATTITIAKGTQAPLTITSTSGKYGTPLALSASGGSDGGAITYGVTSPGTAGCSVSGSSLSATSAGTCSVTATMAGSSGYNPVSSSPTTITIARAATTTVLHLSAATVTYGHEQVEVLSVSVTSAAGKPTGTVTIGGTGCVITLVAGKGSCVLTKKALATGTHHLVATYSGSTDFSSSKSSGAKLVVKR